MKRSPQTKKRFPRRRGAALVECALCIPLVLLFSLATLEICSAIFLRETLHIAAYEAVRVGVMRGATEQGMMSQANAILEARGVNNATVTNVTGNLSDIGALEPLTVEVSAPLDQNSFFIGRFLFGRTTSSRMTMLREFD